MAALDSRTFYFELDQAVTKLINQLSDKCTKWPSGWSHCVGLLSPEALAVLRRHSLSLLLSSPSAYYWITMSFPNFTLVPCKVHCVMCIDFPPAILLATMPEIDVYLNNRAFKENSPRTQTSQEHLGNFAKSNGLRFNFITWAP